MDAHRQLTPAARRAWTAAVLFSGLVLTIAHVLPIVTLDELGPGGGAWTVLGGAFDLMRHGDVLLGLLILGFSGVFPFVKLSALLYLLRGHAPPEQRERVLDWVRQLGRWSMLDVFVVVILLGTVRLGVLAEARPEPGVYVFGVAILLSLVCTTGIDRALRADVEPEGRAPLSVPLAALAALVSFGFALALPVVTVERWLLWSSDYSLLAGTLRLLAEGEWLLGLWVVLFVVGLPALDLLALTVIGVTRWRERPSRWTRRLETLHEWCMIDVFGLALLVVLAKLGGLAELTLRPGIVALGISVALAVYANRRLRAAVTAPA